MDIKVVTGYRIGDEATRLLLELPDGREVLASIGEYNVNNFTANPLEFANGSIIPRLKKAEPGTTIKVCRLNATVLDAKELARYRRVVYDIGEVNGGRY